MDDFLMGIRTGQRLARIEDALKGKLTNREGAERAGLSVRQFRRLKQKVRLQGEAGLTHGNRGRRSPRRISARVRGRILNWLRRPEVQVNDCQIAEKLREEEGLEVSRETVRRLRRAEGIAPKRKRRPRVHRRRREREGRWGAMVLVDGSPFRWLGDDQPELDLVGAMDDATGQILSLVFRPHEDTHGYARVLDETFRAYGLPERVYGDRTTVLVRSDDHWTREEELAGRQYPTPLAQALEDLAIRYVAALSPQAKGRIERLWATLQDRLVVELRLRGITTLEAAQRYLPEFIADFNRRFAQTPREADSAWRRPPRELPLILSCRYERTVASDNTVTLEERVVQVPPGPGGRSYAQCRVEVRELLDGRLVVRHDGQTIAEQAGPPGFELLPRRRRLRRFAGKNGAPRSPRIEERPRPSPLPQAAQTPKSATTRPWRPDAQHPWRRFRYSNPPPSPVE